MKRRSFGTALMAAVLGMLLIAMQLLRTLACASRPAPQAFAPYIALAAGAVLVVL